MTNSTGHLDIANWAEGPSVVVVSGDRQEGKLQRVQRHARGRLLGSASCLLTVGVEEAVWVVPTVHAVWLPPHHEHWVRAHGPFECWSAYVAEPICQALHDFPCMILTSGLLREALLRAASWPIGPLDAVRERVAQVIIDEIRDTPPQPLGVPMPRDKRLQRIAHALLDDPALERGLQEWADWAAVSSRTLSRRFVAETGFTFTAWRQRSRMLRALEMLATDQQVSSIALDLGYATPSAFIAVFRQTFGETPADYRQRLVPLRR